MTERCPLTSGNAPSFYYHEAIPEVCLRTCEALWELAIKSGLSDHEEYPDYILSNPECPHFSTEHGNSSLQSSSTGNIRFYGTTERCMSCSDEIAEDSFQFTCPNS